jgi:hypothetical protein
MKLHYLAAAVMTMGLLTAMPAMSQTAPAQKQHTQEGGVSESFECGSPYNANPTGDPDCKRRTQNLTPSPAQATFETSGQKK